MVFVTQMVPFLHVYPRTTVLAGQPSRGTDPGARGISAELSVSEGKKHGPYNR